MYVLTLIQLLRMERAWKTYQRILGYTGTFASCGHGKERRRWRQSPDHSLEKRKRSSPSWVVLVDEGWLQKPTAPFVAAGSGFLWMTALAPVRNVFRCHRRLPYAEQRLCAKKETVCSRHSITSQNVHNIFHFHSALPPDLHHRQGETVHLQQEDAVQILHRRPAMFPSKTARLRRRSLN